MPAVNWPDTIAQYRFEYGLKQEACALDLNVSQSTLSRWETGVTKPPIAVQKKLLDALSRDSSLASPTIRSVKNWFCPAVAISKKGRFLNISKPLSRILPQINCDSIGVCLDDIFRGQVLEIQQMYLEMGFYDGKIDCVEGCYHFEPRESGMEPFYFKVVSWPISNSPGVVHRITQTLMVDKETARETIHDLGGPLRVTPAVAS